MAFWDTERGLEARCPPDRLAAIPMVVSGAAVLAAAKHGHDSEAVLATRFFLGYIAGFTDYLDHVDRQLGGVVRKLASDRIWGSEKGQLRFSQAVVLLNDQDEQTKRGFGFGVPDGQRYSSALEEKRSAAGASTSLESAFALEIVDFTQNLD